MIKINSIKFNNIFLKILNAKTRKLTKIHYCNFILLLRLLFQIRFLYFSLYYVKIINHLFKLLNNFTYSLLKLIRSK